MGVTGVIMMIRVVWLVNWAEKFGKVGVGRHYGEDMLCSCSSSLLLHLVLFHSKSTPGISRPLSRRLSQGLSFQKGSRYGRERVAVAIDRRCD